MCCILLTHSSISEHLGCSYFLTVVNNVAMNMGMHFSLKPHFYAFGNISRSRIVESYCNSICIFLRNYQTVFHSSCPILYSGHTLIRGLLAKIKGIFNAHRFQCSPTLCFLFVCVFIVTILTCANLYFIVV